MLAKKKAGDNLSKALDVFGGVDVVVNGYDTVGIVSRTGNTFRISKGVEMYFKTRRKKGLLDERDQSQHYGHLHGNTEITVSQQLPPYHGIASQ